MKTITVTVTMEKNWAGNEYLIYSTEEHGKIAELDYPNDYKKNFRVWASNIDSANGSIGFSCFSAGLVGAETVAKGCLVDMGYEMVYFKYPKTIKTR